MLEEIFARLGLTDHEASVYLTLLHQGPTTAGNLAKRIAEPRSSLYGFLSKLTRSGLVGQSEEDGVKLWYAEPPERILDLLNKGIDTWAEAKTDFQKLLPELHLKIPFDFTTPRFRYFEGIEGVRSILKDLLLYREIETEAFWPIQNMIEILGREFFEDLNIHRIRQRIYTRAIWPPSKMVDIKAHPFLGVGESFCREIRIAPSAIECSMGYWAYHNKVAFISSRQECFGFIVESLELRKMLQTQFEIIWGVSRSIKEV